MPVWNTRLLNLMMPKKKKKKIASLARGVRSCIKHWATH